MMARWQSLVINGWYGRCSMQTGGAGQRLQPVQQQYGMHGIHSRSIWSCIVPDPLARGRAASAQAFTRDLSASDLLPLTDWSQVGGPLRRYRNTDLSVDLARKRALDSGLQFVMLFS